MPLKASDAGKKNPLEGYELTAGASFVVTTRLSK
jgi:hypothetical protein